MTTFIENIFDITDQYDLIISDVFGVIHNGQTSLPNVHSFFSHVADKVSLLTNDGRCKSTVTSHLDGFDFKQNKHYNDLFTSGFFLKSFYENQDNESLKCFVLDDFLTPSIASINLITSIPSVEVVSDINEANFCFAAGVCKYTIQELENNEELQTILGLLKDKQCKLLCPNPDRLVVYGESDLVPLAGFIAEMYADLGGEVVSFGKPAKYPYEFILNKYKPQKALMIGDTLETDIQGANAVGIDSLLIGTGVTKHTWLQNNTMPFEEWLSQSSIKPTWYIDAF